VIPKLLATLLLTSSLPAQDTPPVPSQRVGLPLEIREIYLPGPELKPKPRRDRKPPLVVRILNVKPAKDGFRYDFEIQGLEPGPHNLTDFLDSPTPLPPIPIEITTPLPPGLLDPHPQQNRDLPQLGGYRQTMIALAATWLLGLIAILLWRKKKPENSLSNTTTPPTLADRIRPLLDQAARHQLDTTQRATLDRLITGHWLRLRPDLATLTPAETLVRLRADPEASPLLLALENWLHSPNPTQLTQSQLDSLLTPYTSTPTESQASPPEPNTPISNPK